MSTETYINLDSSITQFFDKLKKLNTSRAHRLWIKMARGKDPSDSERGFNGKPQVTRAHSVF